MTKAMRFSQKTRRRSCGNLQDISRPRVHHGLTANTEIELTREEETSCQCIPSMLWGAGSRPEPPWDDEPGWCWENIGSDRVGMSMPLAYGHVYER